MWLRGCSKRRHPIIWKKTYMACYLKYWKRSRKGLDVTSVTTPEPPHPPLPCHVTGGSQIFKSIEIVSRKTPEWILSSTKKMSKDPTNFKRILWLPSELPQVTPKTHNDNSNMFENAQCMPQRSPNKLKKRHAIFKPWVVVHSALLQKWL